MESATILKMVEDAFRVRCFIIHVIVSNNKSIMGDMLNHPSIGARGQVLKSSRGKIDEKISASSFLADPSHRMIVFSRHIFSIVNNGTAQRCGCTNADAIRIKKDWGYMIKNNISKSLEELQ